MPFSRIDKPVIVMTGSSGLIGSRLAGSLSERYFVVGLDLEPPASDHEVGKWIACDLSDAASIASALSEIRSEFAELWEAVIHLAAYYDFTGKPHPLYREVTVDGTRHLLDLLPKFAEVKQFLFSSTLLVMKPAEDGESVTEASPVAAEWVYPLSKIAAEQVVRRQRGNMQTVILRLAGVYDEDCHSIPIANQISRIYERQLESYVFPGDKTHGQSFVHLEDVVECFRIAIERRDELDRYEVFLVGEEDVMSYEELQDQIGLLLHGREWPTIRIPKAVARAGAWFKDRLTAGAQEAPFIKPWMISLADRHYPVDIRRARTRLRWNPRHTLRNTLPEMIRRLKSDPVHWYEINQLPIPEHFAVHA